MKIHQTSIQSGSLKASATPKLSSKRSPTDKMNSVDKKLKDASPSTSLENWADEFQSGTLSSKKTFKKNRVLTYGVKLKIINDIENGVKRSVIHKKYKLAPSTLSTFLANKEDIKKHAEDLDYSSDRKRFRKAKHFELEERLWEWHIKEANEFGEKSLTYPIMRKKAYELAKELGISGFKANSGWVWRFRKRRGIIRSSTSKLAQVKPPPPVNPTLIEHWNANIVPGVLRKYDPNDIFIAHETGLFYRCTPESTLPLLGERCKGGRLPKDRLTVMLVCNMTGTEKLPLLVIGRFARPKSLKHAQTLPTEYISTKKVWMLPMFFEQWISKFDTMMENSWRRVALFVAPCVSHTHVENLNSVSLVFLPPDINLQPANQGIIQTLKMNYRRKVIQKYLDQIEQLGTYSRLSVSVMDALFWLREAWLAVTPECITEGFKKAGISFDVEQVPGADLKKPLQDHCKNDFYLLFEKLNELIAMDPQITADGFLSVDNHLLTIGALSSCEMVLARRDATQNNVKDDEEDDQDEEVVTPPSMIEARQSLHRLHKFFEVVEGKEASFSLLTEMEQFVHKLRGSPEKQTTLMDYFTRCPNKKARVPKRVLGYFFPRSSS